ncbi:GNAT family N-acetyltransferase [Roseivirga echinicomitans]|uniref:Ribosomal-protein-serine acetyltransferase n=1 Tax=Roseivirga echinicomitans TaxID=296218 RepID=A0A150XVR3_9BACT|nr:GNAT family N-acetyltransferase [Roseivirga echinicomitans]KYG82851.1 ribosomal-protein-serine acetyltransferase [Roseivirga echinicomitans]
MSKEYKVLTTQVFAHGEYSIVPIRDQDRYDIMQWRNEQIYHLRQAEPLTKERQDAYFDNVISSLFEQEKPHQILFSFLKKGECIGYGGLVHINWQDKHAEISFIMNTELEENFFVSNWKMFLTLIESVAFRELNLNKIVTYAFDLRPQIYTIFEQCGFKEEARLKEHVFYNGHFINVVIHGKLNKN